jgi:hypothetical protein
VAEKTEKILKIGVDLAGWKIETWYQLGSPVDEIGAKLDIIGYFTNKDLALISAKGKGWYAGDGKVSEVLVLTDGSGTGYIVSDAGIQLSDEIKISADLTKKAKDKLSLEERKLLKIN